VYHLQPNSLRGLNALSTITPQALIVSDRLLIAYANTIEPNFNPTTHISSLSIVLLYNNNNNNNNLAFCPKQVGVG
jgi:hypothetical protein